jgi:hypothetical protein
MSHKSSVVKSSFLGLPLLKEIQADPLAAATRLQHQCGEVAELDILFRRIVYFFGPEAVRKLLGRPSRRFSSANPVCCASSSPSRAATC